jgi:hypothetical protein
MSAPTEEHLQWARRLLSQNEDAGEVSAAAAMGPAYDRLLRCAGPLIGNNGVRAILARSLKLAAGQYPSLRAVLLVEGYANDPAKALRACLQGQDTADASTTFVLATFLSLLSSFIGERLTAQIIETAWKSSEEMKK